MPRKPPIDRGHDPANFDFPGGIFRGSEPGSPDPRKATSQKKRKKFSPGEVGLGVLRIRTSELKPKLDVTCLLGEDPPKVTEGYAIWNSVDRFRRKSLLEYTGKKPLLMEVSFLIDYWSETDETLRGPQGPGERCEKDIHNLELMAGLGLGLGDEPPKLLWNANAPHDNERNPYIQWVIEGIDWGDAMRNSLGLRVRQWGTLMLREWVGDEFISSAAEVARGKAKNKGLKGGGTYKVKKNDTLQNIARQLLGDATRWREILKLNRKKIRDPRHLKDGIVLKIPKL